MSSASTQPLGCGAWLFVGGLISGFLLLTLLLMPVRCPAGCGPCAQLIGYTRLPGVTPAEAQRMLAWWENQDCRICGKRRWVTLLERLPWGYGCCD